MAQPLKINQPKPKEFYQEFCHLLESLSRVIFDCTIHTKFCRDLAYITSGAYSKEDYSDVINYCGSFWFLTRESHRVANVINLFKVYDDNGKVLSLPNLLATIKANSDILVYDPKQIEEHIEFMDKNKNSLLKKLVVTRNSIYGHNDIGVTTLRPSDNIKNNSITDKEMVDLATQALSIVNVYNKINRRSLFLEPFYSYGDIQSLSDRRLDNEYILSFIFESIKDRMEKIKGDSDSQEY